MSGSSIHQLPGRTILVAGGAGNVGRHLVAALLEAGATVVAPSRSRDRLDQLRTTIPSLWRERFVSIIGDIGAEQDGARIRDQAVSITGRLDGAVASLGRFVAAPSLLAAPLSDLSLTLEGYLLAHFAVARRVIPVLVEHGGSYTFINGPLAFEPMFPGAGLVSIATAGQAMLGRVLMQEMAATPVPVNELVIYSSFGWGASDARNAITGEDIGRYVAYLLSDRGTAHRGETIHLKSREQLETPDLDLVFERVVDRSSGASSTH